MKEYSSNRTSSSKELPESSNTQSKGITKLPYIASKCLICHRFQLIALNCSNSCVETFVEGAKDENVEYGQGNRKSLTRIVYFCRCGRSIDPTTITSSSQR